MSTAEADVDVADEDPDNDLITLKLEEPYDLLIKLGDGYRHDQPAVQADRDEEQLLQAELEDFIYNVSEDQDDVDDETSNRTASSSTMTTRNSTRLTYKSSSTSTATRSIDCRQKGTAIRSKERQVIRSIIEFCDLEARQKCLMFPLRQATKRAAKYAKISERTVKRIRDESKIGLEFAGWDRSVSGKAAKATKMSYKFCSNLSFMFQEGKTIIDRYQLAQEAGFKAVESGFPLGFTVKQVVEAKKAANVQQVLINVYTGDTSKGELGFAAIPGKEEEFIESIERTIEYAKALECKKIHIMAGVVEKPTHANDTTYEQNLRYAVDRLSLEHIVGLIEPINNITVPNYYMNSFEKGLAVVKKINSPHLKLLVDVFHLQLCRGKITNSLENYLPYIGHVQVAQVPDRNEPDTVGEINYKYVFSLLEKFGYKDYIGLEYKPRAGTVEGLKWLNNFGCTL